VIATGGEYVKIIAIIAMAVTLAGIAPVTTRAQSTQYGTENADPEAGVVGPVGFNIGGAVSFPLSDASDVADPGGGVVAGLTYRPHPMFGIRAEYMYSFYGLQDDLFGATSLDGSHSMQYGTLNFVVRPAKTRGFGFYVIGGAGIYYRKVEITRLSGVSTATFCDPWAFVCYPENVAVANVLAARSSTDFGLNGGVGAYLTMGRSPLRVYLEARYHFMWGPSFTDASGEKRSANGQYIPIVLGLGF
jgi:hypothetical protein